MTCDCRKIFMKRFLSLMVFVFLGITTVCAQKYIVFRVQGDVVADKNVVASGDVLTSAMNVVIGPAAELMVIDEENNKIVTIKGEAAGLFSGIITAKSNSFKDVTSKYVSYMKQKLSNKGKDKDYMQSAGTSYRDLDSIAKKRLLDNKAIIKNESSTIKAQ